LQSSTEEEEAMTYTPTTRRPSFAAPRRRRGLGMVELLIAMSISASLLTAVAVAVDACFRGYRANQEQAILMQRSRVSQNFVCTSIRTTKMHSPLGDQQQKDFDGGAIVTDTGIEMFDLNDKLVKFEWDVPTKRLLVTQSGKTNVLAYGVEDFNVRMEPMRSATSVKTGGGYDLLKRATVNITVRTTAENAVSGESTGTQTLTLSASVMPRRNVW
jgi:prepilin-type N-terminal cleavage/methylation domain-containing protein